MKLTACLVALAGVVGPFAAKAAPDPVCMPLRAFVVSVAPRESREVVFQTRWGSNFKGAVEPALVARRCTHGGYAPAKVLCSRLLKYGATEFADENIKDALACLSPGLRFDSRTHVIEGSFSLDYGTDQRGSNVTLELRRDGSSGGLALRIRADGY